MLYLLSCFKHKLIDIFFSLLRLILLCYNNIWMGCFYFFKKLVKVTLKLFCCFVILAYSKDFVKMFPMSFFFVDWFSLLVFGMVRLED